MKIAIIGLGYVGLPLSLQFASKGAKVIGLDVDANKVASLCEGRSYIKHISHKNIHTVVEEGSFEPSIDFSRVRDVEAVIICVPTPLNKYREPDVSYVLNTARAIAPFLGDEREETVNGNTFLKEGNGHGALVSGSGAPAAFSEATGTAVRHSRFENGQPPRPKLVVLESTSYPGTTDEDLRAVLEEESGLSAGIDFHLAFSPEREDPGNPRSRVADLPKVIGGYTPACRERAMELYGLAVESLVPVSSCRAAEATKLLENIFRSVNIALVNELKVIYDAMGVDIWETIEAAKTKPFGFMPFYPGPGLGGHCIPIDPFYLTWKAREFHQHTRFIELAGEIHTTMGAYVLKKVAEALNRKSLPLRGSRILLMGIAYKADVDDMRESATFALMDGLKAAGAEVHYFDPWIPEIPPSREHEDWTGTRSVEWNQEAISSFDCVVISTAHSNVDYRKLHDWCDCIVDTRNAMGKAGINGDKVIKA